MVSRVLGMGGAEPNPCSALCFGCEAPRTPFARQAVIFESPDEIEPRSLGLVCCRTVPLLLCVCVSISILSTQKPAAFPLRCVQCDDERV